MRPKYDHDIVDLFYYIKCDQNTIIIWRTYFSLAKIGPKDDNEIVNLF